MIADWFAALLHRPLPRSQPGSVKGVIRKHNLVIAYALTLIAGRYPLG